MADSNEFLGPQLDPDLFVNPIKRDYASLAAPDTEEFRRFLKQQHVLAQAAIQPISLPTGPIPERVDWSRYQTPVKDQQDRGSCWSFGSIAALEARIKRQFDQTVNLSEQYFFHLGRATGLRGDYLTTPQKIETATSWWDYGGSSLSVSALGDLAATEEERAPYMTHGQLDALRRSIPGVGALDWSPEPDLATTQDQIDLFEWDDRLVPRAARWNARYRVKSWESIDTSISTLERWLAYGVKGHDVIADVNVKWRWDPSSATYEWDPNAEGGGHVVLLVGYDRARQRFLMKNSWNEGRIVSISYDALRTVEGISGAAVVKEAEILPLPDARHSWLGTWNMDHDGWRGRLVIRRFAPSSARTKLGTYHASDGTARDVNGYMDDGGRHICFTIADAPGRRAPASTSGQQFDAYVFSWAPSLAAGKTTWQQIPFGVVMSRDPLRAHITEAFSQDCWRGEWLLNHDGWQGEFQVRSFVPTTSGGMQATAQVAYTPLGGTSLPASAGIVKDRPHHMRLWLGTGSRRQQFELFYFTREGGLLAGTTQSGGKTFGVYGARA